MDTLVHARTALTWPSQRRGKTIMDELRKAGMGWEKGTTMAQDKKPGNPLMRPYEPLTCKH